MVCLVVRTFRANLTSEKVPFWLFICSFMLLTVKVWTGPTGYGQLAGLINMSVRLWITCKEGVFFINLTTVSFWKRTPQSPWRLNGGVFDCDLAETSAIPIEGFRSSPQYFHANAEQYLAFPLGQDRFFSCTYHFFRKSCINSQPSSSELRNEFS
jgi:hypothetical protein